MKKILSMIIVLFAVVSFVGCSKTVGKIVKKDKKEIYVNDRYDFKFELPSNWKDKYEFKEAGGTSSGDKDILKFQVEFRDKNYFKKEVKDREIFLRIYVYNKKEIERLAKKENKDIDSYMEADELQGYLGKDKKSVYTASGYKSMDMTLDEMKNLFSIAEK